MNVNASVDFGAFTLMIRLYCRFEVIVLMLVRQHQYDFVEPRYAKRAGYHLIAFQSCYFRYA